MADQVLQELSRQTVNIGKFEEATLSWHRSCLTVLSEKGVHFFEFSHNIGCWDKKIDLVESFIGHPKSNPAANLFTDKVINKSLKNIDQTEMIIDHSLWPHNQQLLTEMSTIVDFKWAPAGIINSENSAIAILTNVGVVEIYTQSLFKWHRTLEISSLLNGQFDFESTKPKSFNTLKDTAHMLATSAICWSQTLNQDNSCYFITAQKNSNIILWLIECTDGKATANIVGSLQVDTCEICSMIWIPISNENFFLICSNIIGQIIVLDCKLQSNGIELAQFCTIWSHKDRMVSKFMEYIEIDGNICLICNKHRHFLAIRFDKECNVLGHYINNINDYRITSISKVSNEIYVSTINSKLYKLNKIATDNEPNLSFSAIVHQGLSSTYDLHGMSYSQNQVLCAICVIDRKVNCRKDPLKLEIIFMTTKQILDTLLNKLLMNPTKQLTDYWDVIEVMRYKCMKTKLPPSINYEQLFEMAPSDVYMLKVYLILCTICDNLKKTFRIYPDFYLPEENVEIVKEEILVANADKIIQKYSTKFREGSKLNDLEKEYLIGAKKFLEYYFEKNQRELYDVIDPSILNIVDSNTSFECQCCDEIIKGFMCKNDHLNMFCALTFTPINDDNYLICKWCNLTARKELFLDSPLCLFCDVNLIFVDNN